jgi:hypothetical protein
MEDHHAVAGAVDAAGPCKAVIAHSLDLYEGDPRRLKLARIIITDTRGGLAGLALLYLGAAVLVARLSSEVTKISYDRHLLFTNRFTECAPARASTQLPWSAPAEHRFACRGSAGTCSSPTALQSAPPARASTQLPWSAPAEHRFACRGSAGTCSSRTALQSAPPARVPSSHGLPSGARIACRGHRPSRCMSACAAQQPAPGRCPT